MRGLIEEMPEEAADKDKCFRAGFLSEGIPLDTAERCPTNSFWYGGPTGRPPGDPVILCEKAAGECAKGE